MLPWGHASWCGFCTGNGRFCMLFRGFACRLTALNHVNSRRDGVVLGRGGWCCACTSTMLRLYQGRRRQICKVIKKAKGDSRCLN